MLNSEDSIGLRPLQNGEIGPDSGPETFRGRNTDKTRDLAGQGTRPLGMGTYHRLCSCRNGENSCILLQVAKT